MREKGQILPFEKKSQIQADFLSSWIPFPLWESTSWTLGLVSKEQSMGREKQ